MHGKTQTHRKQQPASIGSSSCSSWCKHHNTFHNTSHAWGTALHAPQRAEQEHASTTSNGQTTTREVESKKEQQ
eukprot:m.11582 g.11582  ORF g.11582 m.11582 type:complete len:74 (+) comp5808_c0_seq1:114-335(+)